MNQFIKVSFFLCWLLSLTQCTPDYLDEEPKGIMTPEKLMQQKGGIEFFASELPNKLTRIFDFSQYFVLCMGGDDLIASPFGAIARFRYADQFSDNDQTLPAFFNKLYNTIHSSNQLLTYADQSIDSESVVNDCIGMAYFYRAYSYFILTRSWGEIPLITEFRLNRKYDDIPLSKVEEVYDLIVSDLQKAEQLLPESRVDENYPGAKPLKGAAKLLLSKVYITIAGWPLKKQEYYSLSAKKSLELIEEVEQQGKYGYELENNFADLWTWANNYTNKEIVFGLHCNFNGRVSTRALCSRPYEYYSANYSMGWSYYMPELSFFNRFPDGPRKEATFQTMIENDKYGYLEWSDDRTMTRHPYFKKYHDDHPEATWYGARTEQILRFAEAYLIYAEAKAMSDGPDQSAYDAINKIRNRAGLPNLQQGLSAEAFRDSVFAERGWEFAGDEATSRFYDLIRLEKLEEFMALRDKREYPLDHFPDKSDYWFKITEEYFTFTGLWY